MSLAEEEKRNRAGAHTTIAARPKSRIQAGSALHQFIQVQSAQLADQPQEFCEDTLIEHLPLGRKTIKSLRTLSLFRLADFAFVTQKELQSRARVGRVTLKKIEGWLVRSNVPFMRTATRSSPQSRGSAAPRLLPPGDAGVESLPLGPRALKSLQANSIHRLSDLCKFDDRSLKNLPWIGAKVASDLRTWYACALDEPSTSTPAQLAVPEPLARASHKVPAR